MKHIKLAKSEQRTDLTPYSFNNVVAAFASSAETNSQLHRWKCENSVISLENSQIKMQARWHYNVSSVLLLLFAFPMFMILIIKMHTQKKHKTIALNFIARYNHDYKTLNAFASWIEREFVLVCNEMHIFSLV